MLDCNLFWGYIRNFYSQNINEFLEWRIIMKSNIHTAKNVQVRLILVVGIFDTKTEATKMVEKLLEQDFAADRVSLLNKGSGLGDDMLGLSYKNSIDRLRLWTIQGLFWGGVWGLLSGGARILPLTDAANLIVEIVTSVVVGAITGAVTMAVAAIMTELVSNWRKIKLPREQLDIIREAIDHGNSIVILHCDQQHSEQYVPVLKYAGANTVVNLAISI